MRTRGNNLYISLRSERFKQRGWDNGRQRRTGEKWEVVAVVAEVVDAGAGGDDFWDGSWIRLLEAAAAANA